MNYKQAFSGLVGLMYYYDCNSPFGACSGELYLRGILQQEPVDVEDANNPENSWKIDRETCDNFNVSAGHLLGELDLAVVDACAQVRTQYRADHQ
ncbi:uncharacterized protein FSUBG_2066 [Fusarium subglutinans]|uniref:Uncharacterized protein n=1 Tax=Gibberella subglutinans TaxID=42677 RepID=A0A8H5V805_GIBSU|nr:uncharacterized protein FSUBG_2066 [Fusarium subglutinans]KAF5611629.1 hypothetical protein FSUBG_2066 [Fusarium subglutinans]